MLALNILEHLAAIRVSRDLSLCSSFVDGVALSLPQPRSIPFASLAGFKFYLTLWSRDGGAGMVEQGWRRVLEPYRRFLSVGEFRAWTL